MANNNGTRMQNGEKRDAKRSSSPKSVINAIERSFIDKSKGIGSRQQHPYAKLSPAFFIVSVVVTTLLSYHVGTLFKTRRIALFHYDFATSLTRHSSADIQEKLKAAGRFRRSSTKLVVTCTHDDLQCPETRELAVDEVFFAEGYGRYDGDNKVITDADEDDVALAFQVLMDFQRMDFHFLREQDLVRDRFIDTIWEVSKHYDFSIIYLHCQKLVGVVCVAILSGGSHMTVATDPDNLSCSLSLYVGDNAKHLLDVIPILEANFGVGGSKRIVFRHLLRGAFDYRGTALEHDLTEFLLHEKDRNYYKKEVGSNSTDFQEIHVWDTLHTNLQSVDSYERSLEAGEDNYYTKNPELFSANRLLFLDGVMQSTSKGDEAYHEALVHPAMFAHSQGPKRAAIIGGGEGATLREILKHKSVEVCTMIEIDEGMVKAARNWLPLLNDCSDFGRGSCFDEERTDLRCEDAFGWFVKRFNTETEVPEELRTDPFDVIIVDALDPEDNVPFAVQLYKDQHFWGTMKETLTENGILVIQLGMTPRGTAYGEQFGINRNRANLFKTIDAVGFHKVFIYHDIHSDFKYPWSYLAACKSEVCEKEWHQNEAQINLRIQERLLPSKSGKPLLKYFDGATMHDYQRPYKSWENAHCRQLPEPEECSFFRNFDKEAIMWADVFETVAVNGDTFLIAKSQLSKGTILYRNFDSTGPVHFLFPASQLLLAGPFIGPNTTCHELTMKISEASWAKRISPLLSRRFQLHELEALTRDISEGETIKC